MIGLRPSNLKALEFFRKKLNQNVAEKLRVSASERASAHARSLIEKSRYLRSRSLAHEKNQKGLLALAHSS